MANMPVRPVDFPPTPYIEIRDGQARLAGRVTKVKMVISRIIHGQSTIEETMEQYGITRSEVYACLAYYYEHKDAIDRHFDEMEQLVSEHARPLSELLDRWRATKMSQEQEDEL
jgi:uncharacterized protein (DUF433 family)